jgi:hypothetical protein
MPSVITFSIASEVALFSSTPVFVSVSAFVDVLVFVPELVSEFDFEFSSIVEEGDLLFAAFFVGGVNEAAETAGTVLNPLANNKAAHNPITCFFMLQHLRLMSSYTLT